jgi:hypothetical protein
MGLGKSTDRILDAWEVLRTQFVEILRDVLVRKIATQCDTMNLAVFSCKLTERSSSLALFYVLKEAVEVESRGRATDEAMAAKLK